MPGTRKRILAIAWLLLPHALAPGHAIAAPDDDETQAPGLVANFGAEGQSPRPTRIDPDLSWDWGDGSPDARIPSDGFTARWEGLLLIHAPGTYRFFPRTDGRVTIVVAGQVAWDGGAEAGASASNPIKLEGGPATLLVEYRHARGSARVAIDWEGPGFAREPLPARVLFHDPKPVRAELISDRFEDGRRQADRLGCANCHALLDLPRHSQLGPPLSGAGRAIAPDWLSTWLADPVAVRAGTRMPSFGHGLPAPEVADLAAFLRRLSKPIEPTAEVKMALNVADTARGRLLFRISGCLACHTRGPTEVSGDRVAPDLADIGRKRSAAWVAWFLAREKASSPAKHRPDLGLSPDMAAHLASYLVSDPPAPPAKLDEVQGDAERGKALVARYRCAACHAIPGVATPPSDLPLRAGSDADAGCLAEDVRDPRVPRFSLTRDHKQALRSFVSQLPAKPSPTPAWMLAWDTIRRRNCFGCHARDGRGGEALGRQLGALLEQDATLGAWKGTLTPPNLTGVGDKLRPEMLDMAIRGQAPFARPWLSIRMPAYAFEPGEAEAISAYLRGHDRSTATPDPPRATTHPDGKTIEAAATLLGQRGFGCVSCHVLAGKIPPGGEPETLGPDLALAHRRMTERYFRRWIADPQRIIPGTPMPQFLMPIASQPGTLNDQLSVLWSLLGSDRVAEVAAFGTREILKPQGDRPLVVRDMVILPDKLGFPEPAGRYVPRGLAIGLKNGLSLLFDTDRLAWVAYWRGGFLSRAKSGRLWEWHPEGQVYWRNTQGIAPLLFVTDGAKHEPTTEHERYGTFKEVAFEKDGITLSYDLKSPTGPRMRVEERIRPTDDGWERQIRALKIPRGLKMALSDVPGSVGDSHPPGDFVTQSRSDDGEFRATIRFKAR